MEEKNERHNEKASAAEMSALKTKTKVFGFFTWFMYYSVYKTRRFVAVSFLYYIHAPPPLLPR